jgi:hypothetical protein
MLAGWLADPFEIHLARKAGTVAHQSPTAARWPVNSRGSARHGPTPGKPAKQPLPQRGSPMLPLTRMLRTLENHAVVRILLHRFHGYRFATPMAIDRETALRFLDSQTTTPLAAQWPAGINQSPHYGPPALPARLLRRGIPSRCPRCIRQSERYWRRGRRRLCHR